MKSKNLVCCSGCGKLKYDYAMYGNYNNPHTRKKLKYIPDGMFFCSRRCLVIWRDEVRASFKEYVKAETGNRQEVVVKSQHKKTFSVLLYKVYFVTVTLPMKCEVR
jgi:hypothetical protein